MPILEFILWQLRIIEEFGDEKKLLALRIN